MRKVFLVIELIIIFLVMYILQTNFFSWFNIAGVKPNIIVIFVVFIGLFTNRMYGLGCGILFGILVDVFISKKIGLSAIMLGGIGVLGGIFDKQFSKDSKITIIGIVAISTLLYETASYIINSAIFSYVWEIKAFIRIIIIEVIYNAILTIIFYPTIQKSGYNMQELFKENKILTRYY